MTTEFFYLRQAFLQNDALRTAKLRMDERLLRQAQREKAEAEQQL